MKKNFSAKKVGRTLVMLMGTALILTGCASTSPTVEPTTASVSSASVLHPASASTIATSTEPLGAFNVNDLGVSNIVNVAFIESKIGDPSWVIIDGRSKEDYEKGHIPGAVNFGKTIVTTLKHPVDGRVLPKDVVAKLMGQIGISVDKKLIVYGTKTDYHVGIEMYPLYLGVPEWDYLDGGYEGWVKANKKVDTAPVKLAPTTFTLNVKNKNLYVSTEQLAAIVEKKAPKVTIIDTRSEGEYTGATVDGIRGGHIPGALWFTQTVNQDKEGFFLAKDKLAELYKDIPKDNTIILYCHRGCRTTFSFLALRSLGYTDVRVYEDGFIVWGAQQDKPVDDEHYANFRGTNSTIADLQKQIKVLQAQ